MRRVQLRMQRKQVAYGLFHERIDLRFLRGGGIDLDVQMLEHMIDVGGHVGGTVRAVHHHPMAAAQAGAPGRNAGGDDSARDECNRGAEVEQETAERLRAGGGRQLSGHGQSSNRWWKVRFKFWAGPVSRSCAVCKVL